MVSTPTRAIDVRHATSGDIPRLGQLGALLIDIHHALDPTRFVNTTANTVGLYAAYLDAQREKANVVLLVAHIDNTLIGYSYAAIEGSDPMALRGPAGVVYDLVVDGAHRRRGAARMLIEATRTQLAAKGAPRIVLSTAARNAPAQQLFAAMGFRPTMIEMTDDLAPHPETRHD